jgi:hypothetical protein
MNLIARCRHLKFMAALAASALFGAGASAAPSMSTAEILAKAPVFQLLLDNSGSSPATDADFVNTAWPVIEGRLRSMPMGTVIIVNSVGDASLAPLSMRTRIQKLSSGEGAPLEDIVQVAKSIVLGFPKRVQATAHGQSHLVGAIFDASKNINQQSTTRNVIIVLSDLVEFSPLANCHRNRTCPLPKPSFQLGNTDLLALGVGRGLPSDREMAIFAAWEKFLDQAGARHSLKKTF